MIARVWSRVKAGIAGHPAERALHRFADDELSGDERQQLATHLLRCARCRAVVSDVRALGDAVRAPDAEAPDLATLRDRVLARRTAGVRVILPVPSSTTGEPIVPATALNGMHIRASGRWRGLAAAALIGVIAGGSAVGGLWQSFHRGEGQRARIAPLAMGTTLDVTGGDGCSLAGPSDGGANPSVAERESAALRRVLADDGLAALVPMVGCHTPMAVALPVREFDASRVRPMTITYRARTVVDTIEIESDERTLAIARVTLNGQPAWGITGHTDRYPLVSKEADSLYLSVSGLRPLREISFGSHGARRMRVDLTGDAGILHLDGYRERAGADTTTFERSLELVHQPGAILGPAPLEAVLPALGLRDGWSGSVNVLAPQCLICSMSSVGWPSGSFTNAPLIESLQVDGTDHLVVAAGGFDCWRIRVAGGIAGGSNDRGVHTIWVAKNEHVIVKDVTAWIDSDGIRYERTRELTHFAGG